MGGLYRSIFSCILLLVHKVLFFLALRLASKDRLQIHKNLCAVYFDQPPSQQELHEATRAIIAHQLWILLEFFVVTLFGVTPRVQNQQAFVSEGQKILQKSRGLLVVTGHNGQWEFAGRAAATIKPKHFWALAKPSRNKWATRLLQRMRESMNIQLLWTDHPTLFREMKVCLDQGGILGFVMDQKPPSRQGVRVNFLGTPTLFVAGPAVVATKYQVPIIYFACLRKGILDYTLEFQAITSHLEQDVSVEELTKVMASHIESTIRQHPWQWLWNYRRWSDQQLQQKN